MLRVKEITRSKGMTVAALAEKMGIKAPSLSRIITRENATTDTLQRIANALDVEVADLFEKSEKNITTCPHCGKQIKIAKE